MYAAISLYTFKLESYFSAYNILQIDKTEKWVNVAEKLA